MPRKSKKRTKKQVPKYRCFIAHSLEDKQYRPKVIRDKTKYTRKEKHDDV